MPKKYDLTGQVIGKLTVLKQLGSNGTHMMYLCRCECGKEVTVRGTEMRNNRTRSCGSPGCRKWHNKEKCMGNTDCFAFVKRQGGAVCSALTEMKCLKGECKFYAPLGEVCKDCHKDCDRCLTVSHQRQLQSKIEEDCDYL